MITLAQGLADPKAAGIISDFYSDQWNDLAWPESLVANITSSKPFDKLTKGDTVKIPIEPVVTVSAFVEGAPNPMDRLIPSTQEIVIDKAFKFNTGVGPVTQELSYVDLLGAYQKGGRKSSDKYINEQFFAWLSGKAATANKGNTAGVKSGRFVLGTAAAPVKVGPSTLLAYLTQFNSVFGEQELRKDSISIILPDILEWMFLNTELKSVSVSGDDKSKLISGMMGQLGRQKFYISTYATGTGTQADPFHIYALTKQGAAFTMRMNSTDLWKYDNYDVSARGMGVFGFGVVKDWALAEGYVYLDTAALPQLS
jgi:hypothetical protein